MSKLNQLFYQSREKINAYAVCVIGAMLIALIFYTLMSAFTAESITEASYRINNNFLMKVRYPIFFMAGVLIVLLSGVKVEEHKIRYHLEGAFMSFLFAMSILAIAVMMSSLQIFASGMVDQFTPSSWQPFLDTTPLPGVGLIPEEVSIPNTIQEFIQGETPYQFVFNIALLANMLMWGLLIAGGVMLLTSIQSISSRYRLFPVLRQYAIDHTLMFVMYIVTGLILTCNLYAIFVCYGISYRVSSVWLPLIAVLSTVIAFSVGVWVSWDVYRYGYSPTDAAGIYYARQVITSMNYYTENGQNIGRQWKLDNRRPILPPASHYLYYPRPLADATGETRNYLRLKMSKFAPDADWVKENLVKKG